MTTRSWAFILGAAAALVGVGGGRALGQCPDWIPTFGEQPGVSETVHALTVFDDGTGQALYVGGDFTAAGSVLANRIGKWDGTSWSPLGSGLDGTVRALAVFDDGTGPALYAGGFITSAAGNPTSNIAKWNGTSWSPLGSGLDGIVLALSVFDAGMGPALYAGGIFTSAGGVAASSIARWDGASWSPVGSGLAGDQFLRVGALTVFDDGTGAALYAGGVFNSAGGIAASNIAKWDGMSWSALGSGVAGDTFADVNTLTVFDDGTGPALYAGGFFTTAGGVAVNSIAKWDGVSWSALGNLGGSVRTLGVFDDGTGPALFAGGDIATAGVILADNIAKWDGTSWSPLGSGLDRTVWALTVFDNGTGPALFAAGAFEFAGTLGASFIVRWDGAAWSPLGSGISGIVDALAVFDDGTGPALYAGGEFAGVGGIEASRLAKWDGNAWSPVGTGFSSFANQIVALTVFDDGTGAALYAGGPFTFLVDFHDRFNFIAKWDGVAWSLLGSGLDHEVNALTVFDDGTGPALYAGGRFHAASGVAANHVAKWDGTSWSPLGSGVGSSINEWVNTLTVFDDGTGPALFAGGNFTSARGAPANKIAKWDGVTWSALGSGLDGTVRALAVFDDGTGPALYVGGNFSTAGGVAASRIAKWNGAAWSPLGSGLDGVAVGALTVFDDGTGSALFAGGHFTSSGGVAVNNIAKWDGTKWSTLGGGVTGEAPFRIPPVVFALTTFDDGTGPDLFIGGTFTASPGGDSFLARWGGPNGPVCPGDANADGVVDFGDVTSVIGNWLSDGSAGGDANCNNRVDFKDITSVVANWLAACP